MCVDFVDSPDGLKVQMHFLNKLHMVFNQLGNCDVSAIHQNVYGMGNDFVIWNKQKKAKDWQYDLFGRYIKKKHKNI